MSDHEVFYVTFGRRGIRDGFVKLYARDEDQAREFSRDEYGAVWSGIYTEDDWQPEFFPAGQIGEVIV